MKKAVIIGSGLGGLACGCILSRAGYDVTILEQGVQAGGCLQCFERRGVRFETGMHFIGSARRGEVLDSLLRYLGIAGNLRLSPLDPMGYDTISLGGNRYRIANGREAFVGTLAEQFPEERKGLEKYADLVARVAGSSPLHTLNADAADAGLTTEYQLVAMDEVIDSLIADPTLRGVLAGSLPLYAAERGRTPFSHHAFITDFYNHSAFRIVGGSDALTRAFVSRITENGGRVLTRRRVTAIDCDTEKALRARCANGEAFEADLFISDAHPAETLRWLSTPLLRPAYRHRVASLRNTPGCFALYLHFRPGRVPYMNTNFYGYRGTSPYGCEEYTAEEWPKGWLYMHFCHEDRPQYAESGVILSYMSTADVARWEDTRVGRRGADYEAFKETCTRRLLADVEREFPGLSGDVLHYYTSTPLTYRDYTSTPGGSMYGIAKDITAGAAGRVPHRTRIPNLLLTGQNVNSHGMLGTLVGAIVTCSELLGTKTIYEQIREAAQ